jgi:hypothetical protein
MRAKNKTIQALPAADVLLVAADVRRFINPADI